MPSTAQEQLLVARTLDKTLTIPTEIVEMPTADQHAAGGKEQESVCSVKDLELLTDGTKELLKWVPRSYLRSVPWARRCLSVRQDGEGGGGRAALGTWTSNSARPTNKRPPAPTPVTWATPSPSPWPSVVSSSPPPCHQLHLTPPQLRWPSRPPLPPPQAPPCYLPFILRLPLFQ